VAGSPPHFKEGTGGGAMSDRSAPDPRAPDPFDALLDARVRPAGWSSPAPAARYDLVVLGAGTAGLVAAAGAAGLGARVALIERDRMGGDCLNTGCVPSKALLRSARAAAEARLAPAFGVGVGDVAIDFPAVMTRLRRLRAELSGHDSAMRLRDLGVDVFFGEGRFVSDEAIAVGEAILRFRRALIATGARPSVPTLPGLERSGFLTSESVFGLLERPRRLAVIGAGPIGCELGQAFARLGSKVTLLSRADRILPRENPDAAEILRAALVADGVEVHLAAQPLRVGAADGESILHWTAPGGDGATACDAILVATGRTANVEGLGLEQAGIGHGPGGIEVDDHLRTTNRRVFASGDVCLGDKFTHAADAASRLVLRNALFAGRRRVSDLLVPRCTFTDPEVAHVGLDPAAALRRGIALDSIEVAMREVDRAVLDGEAEGWLRVHLRRGTDRILGATMVGRHAGETLAVVVLAMNAGVGLGRIAETVHAYPTRAEVVRKAADAYQRTRLTPTAKWLLSAWLRLGR